MNVPETSVPVISPCKGCRDRVVEPNCHGTCERYIVWKTAVENRRENMRMESQMNRMSDSMTAWLLKKMRKKRK